MEKLVEFFVNNATTDKMWIAFVAIAIYCILKLQPLKVVEHFSRQKEQEHVMAKDLLESAKLSKEANDFLCDYLERIAFKRCYGVFADRDMRSALIKFHRKHQRELTWPQLRRAYPNITLQSGTQIVATLKVWDHVFRWMVTLMAWSAGFYALVVIAVVTYTAPTIAPLQYFGFTALALTLLLVAVLFSTMNWAYHNTQKVIQLLKRAES